MLKRNQSKIPRRSDQTKLSKTRNPLKYQLGTPEIKTGQVLEPADREGKRDGSVHVGKHLSPLRLKAGAGLMGQQVKWPQKMKAPDSFRNPSFWCDSHRYHGHKTEDCVTLKIKVNELLRKGHLREFLSEKSKSHLSKKTTGKPTEAAPISPPRQD